MIEKTCGFIISRRLYRDTSLILKIYTRDFGKIEGIVKGVRKIEDYGRYDGLLNLFCEYEVIFYRRRSELKLFVQFYLLNSWWELTQDYNTFCIASSGFEFLNYIMPPEQPSRAIYELTGEFLKWIIKGSPEIFYYAFVLKLLKFSGFNPQIDCCLICGRKIFPDAYFSICDGGIICDRCKKSSSNLHPISPGVIKSIIFLEQKSWEDISRLRLTFDVKEELHRLLKDFIGFHLNYTPRALTVLENEVVFAG